MADQHERAFQKQDAVFLASKKAAAKASKLAASASASANKDGTTAVSTKKSAVKRYYKNIGLGFTTPRSAKEERWVDKKCPFTGSVSIRGRILKGMCISAGKMMNTAVMRRTYLHYIKKFNRFEKRHSNCAIHVSPAFDLTEGDIVTAGQCRPLSKTVRFNVVKVEKNQIFGSAKKQFRLF